MTFVNKKVRRDVIPRWRLSAAKRDLDALPAKESSVVVRVGPQQSPETLFEEFIATKKPLLGAEVLSSALTLGDMDVAVRTAKLLREFDLSSRPVLENRVRAILNQREEGERREESYEERVRGEIRTYKRITRIYPHSPLGWLDLAFAYTALGQVERAASAVTAAISLEPNHRAVVRAASRFFVHKGEFDRALSVLGTSNLLKVDPWLVSAHIATSRAGGLASPLIGIGRKMFKDDAFRADQVSELGAALATNELEHGNSKLAKKLVGRALVAPTENAVAQIAWLETTEKTNFDAAEVAEKLPRAWEARTFELFERSEWRKSCEEAERWLCDQPFSSRPAVHGSYVAATFLEDYAMSLKFAEAGYRANSTDVVVANNYSVALAEMERLADARRVFTDISRLQDPRWRSTLRATEGLLLYREGDLEGARAAYEDARQHFSHSGDVRSELLASVYQAREECRLGNIKAAHDLLVPLLDVATDSRYPDHGALKQLAVEIERRPE